MKHGFDKSSSVYIRPLKPGDMEPYITFCQSLPDPERYKSYWENEGAKLFDGDGNYVMFALWNANKIVGQTLIAFDPDHPDKLAVFCESEIHPEYRGKGYARNLYEARFNFLRDSGFKGEIETHIKANNTPSIKSALRNGFSDTEETHKGFNVYKAVLCPFDHAR